MTTYEHTFKFVLGAAGVLLCLASFPFETMARCVKLPDTLDMRCEGEDCKSGILWKSSDENEEGKYHPRIQWKGDVEASQFEVVVVDENGQQVPWPYPLGQGLYLAMKGSFLVEGDKRSGGRAEFSIENPGHQYGYFPLATITTNPVDNAVFDFHSSQGWYTLYIMNLGGESFEGQMVPNIPRLWLTVRAAGSNPGKSTRSNQNASDGIVCSRGSIALVSPCSLQVDPTTITFNNMRSTGTANRLEQVKSSNVTISCDSGEKHNVYLRVWPAKISHANKTWARFSHNNGRNFRGLALIHKLNKAPTSCDDGDVWGDAAEFGETKDSAYKGTIHWGLCRTAPKTDTGEYSTTAVVYFWVD